MLTRSLHQCGIVDAVEHVLANVARRGVHDFSSYAESLFTAQRDRDPRDLLG